MSAKKNTLPTKPNTSETEIEIQPNTSETILEKIETNPNTSVNHTNTFDTHAEFREDLKANTDKPQQLSLRVEAKDFTFWDSFRAGYETNAKAFSDLIILAQKQPETKTVEIEKVVETVKEVPVQLTPDQAIINFEKLTIEKMRLCRPFISKGDLLPYEKGNDSSFINALVNLSVNKTLDRNFSTIITQHNNRK
jgi:hypothetical protein